LIAAISSIIIFHPLTSKKLLLISIIPLLIDVLLVSLGIYSYSKIISFITGMVFGSIIYLFILTEIEKLILEQISDSLNE
jgi:hypothetical protein